MAHFHWLRDNMTFLAMVGGPHHRRGESVNRVVYDVTSKPGTIGRE